MISSVRCEDGPAAVASGACRTEPVNRRRFLRGGLTFAAGASIVPATGYALLAHFDGHDKHTAFHEARQALQLFAERSGRPSHDFVRADEIEA